MQVRGSGMRKHYPYEGQSGQNLFYRLPIDNAGLLDAQSWICGILEGRYQARFLEPLKASHLDNSQFLGRQVPSSKFQHLHFATFS